MDAFTQGLLSLAIVMVALVAAIWGIAAYIKYKDTPNNYYYAVDILYIIICICWMALYSWRLITDADDDTVIWVGTWLFRPLLLLTLTAIAQDRVYKANGTIVRWLRHILHRE